MTLLVSLNGKDGLVAASDSRGTFGDPRGVTAQNDQQKKLYRVNPQVAVMAAGAGELAATVLDKVFATPGLDGMGVTTFTNTLHTTARNLFAQWFDKFSIQPAPDKPARPDLSFLICGYEENKAEVRTYQLPSPFDFAPFLHNYGFALSGLVQYALYIMNRLYEKDCTTEQLFHLAAYAITETASQDGKVGGPVQMALLTKDDVTILDADKINAIIAANAKRSAALKQSFLEENPNA